MAFTPTQLPIELTGAQPGVGTYVARIRRFDGLVYDVDSATFKSESTVTDPFVPLTAGTGPDQSIRRAFVPLNKTQWTDGDYIVYYHDLGSAVLQVLSEDTVQIWNGTWSSVKPSTPSDIALRMFSVTPSAHKVPGTFGGDHDLMKRQLAYICSYIATQTTNPPPA